jgi:hypothetical protein
VAQQHSRLRAFVFIRSFPFSAISSGGLEDVPYYRPLLQGKPIPLSRFVKEAFDQDIKELSFMEVLNKYYIAFATVRSYGSTIRGGDILMANAIMSEEMLPLQTNGSAVDGQELYSICYANP